jgi:RNA-directed DNA polymerase
MNKSGIKSNLLEDLFRAYYDARHNKRNTINALAFEMNYESNLLALHDDIKYYGRYVDDFILIHTDKDYLLWMIQKIDSYLSTELNLQLHPHKIYLQHYTKGVAYLVAIIKPHRTYVGSRIKGNFYEAIKEQNEITKSQIPTKSEVDAFVTIMTSYLGIMKHHKTYKLRRQMITQNLSENWWKYTYATNNFGKFIMRKA